VKPLNALAAKGEVVEEWVDLHFFRPLGFRLANALGPKRVSPDQVTMASLVIGLIAGHLMFYSNPTLNTVGVMLFVLSDVLDSADGQLARMRGSSTRFGRIFDGVADNLRFINLYLHLLARLALAGSGWKRWRWQLSRGQAIRFRAPRWISCVRRICIWESAGAASLICLKPSMERGPAPWRSESVPRSTGTMCAGKPGSSLARPSWSEPPAAPSRSRSGTIIGAGPLGTSYAAPGSVRTCASCFWR
jgi:hypothetical protein